jgi:Insertion element 4 transposase N-terminal
MLSPPRLASSRPGHLGELTQYLPFELVDDVLEQTRTVRRRLRDLPSRMGVYFLLALAMFPRLATRGSGPG